MNDLSPLSARTGNTSGLRSPEPGPVGIAVIGAGYVGLTTAACLSHLGYQVCAWTSIRSGSTDECRRVAHPGGGPRRLMLEGLDTGRLSFTTDAAAASSGADFVFLCVPTPQGADGAADLWFVEQASAQVAPYLKNGAVVVNKSTVPVGVPKRSWRLSAGVMHDRVEPGVPAGGSRGPRLAAP